MLTIKNLKAGYRPTHNILHGIDLEIKRNEVLAVIGQNGAGKSTLAKAIVNLLPYKQGTVIFDGMDITKLSTRQIINSGIGYFMQGGRVFPHLTIKENLLFAAGKMSKDEFSEQVETLRPYFDLLQKVDMNKEASYLSGGEKHQLSLFMTLLRSPKFLILDEPSAGLSPGNVQKMYDILRHLKEKKEITILLIEQNVEKALEFADRVALLKVGKITKIVESERQTAIEDINKFYFS